MSIVPASTAEGLSFELKLPRTGQPAERLVSFAVYECGYAFGQEWLEPERALWRVHPPASDFEPVDTLRPREGGPPIPRDTSDTPTMDGRVVYGEVPAGLRQDAPAPPLEAGCYLATASADHRDGSVWFAVDSGGPVTEISREEAGRRASKRSPPVEEDTTRPPHRPGSASVR